MGLILDEEEYGNCLTCNEPKARTYRRQWNGALDAIAGLTAATTARCACGDERDQSRTGSQVRGRMRSAAAGTKRRSDFTLIGAEGLTAMHSRVSLRRRHFHNVINDQS